MSTLSFHFHGYQPGDIVRWREPDPLRPQTFEQRHSPVVLRIGPDRIEGRNWTDAVLRTYRRMGSVLHPASGSASVDIEPPAPVWLPEAAYSHETMDSFRESARQASVELDAIGDSIQSAYLVADARQFAHPPKSGEAWARVNSTERLLAIGRDHPLSGDFAFGATTGSEFVASVRSRGNGSLFVANDLESLLANPMQAERFESIVHSLREGGVQVAPPVPPRDAPTLALVDHSSWSDYDDMLSGGITSDTRWTGLRRSDGLVVSRIHRDRPMSQLWKHAFTLATERVETAVRRQSLQLLQSAGLTPPAPLFRRPAGSYGRPRVRASYLGP